MQELLSQYAKEKNKIKSRLEDFEKLSEKEKYQELLFCLLTPQSNAQRCWSAVEEINKLENLEIKKVTEILSTKTRFHNTKAKRIVEAPETWKKIKPKLSEEDILELRNWISENVNGYGLKESSHFLRNIGKSNNQIAILDRHILRNLKNLNLIDEEKVKNKKDYLEKEQAFLNFAEKINIPADELDLLWWSQENGEIFK